MNQAEERAWEVVRRAYAERPPRRARNTVVLASVAAVVVAVAAAVMSPPGRAVFERMREAVGVEHAAPALFSLPASGRLLVVEAENGGVWLVHDNGLKRRLGSYDDAEWSPHGLYFVATKRNELLAVDPNGGIRWSLARRNVSWPRWEGTRTDTRIAYIAASGLRVVAGDGTGDHLLDRYAGDVPPAWDPARLHTLAYYSGGTIVLRRADGPIVWRAPVTVLPSSLAWSTDGRELAVVSTKRIVVLDAKGHVRRTISQLNAQLLQAAFQPGSHRLAVSIRHPGRSEVKLVDVDHPGTAKLLFAGPGSFGDVAWSPSGNWLLVAWPTADQWVFLHGARVQAVGNIREQFPRADHLGPLLQLAGRWCCSR
ncbi:MAG TPA: hypothetical protein VF379_08460 [Gaiellaceae bacterium]